VLSGNHSQGIALDGAGTSANFVQGNFIGTDPTGFAAMGNRYAGVELFNGASSNVIGGTSAAARNVIAGNASQGVAIDGIGSVGNRVQGNYIGVDVTGGTPLANAYSGVEIFAGGQSNTIGGSVAARNVLSGNISQGVEIDGVGTSGNVVQGNLIGLDASGATAIPNGAGVGLFSGAESNLIGGTAPGARNVISGNGCQGVVIADSDTGGNIVQGNYLGLNLAGTATAPNGCSGVEIFGGAHSNVVGGDIGARNIISGNSTYGVLIADTNTDANVVQGNTIGLDPTGAITLGNSFQGVVVFNAARNNQIGGIGDGAGNLIASNGSDGVDLYDDATTNNSIRGNSIYGNLGSGIGEFNGSEKSQAAPVLDSATVDTNTIVTGSLTSSSNATFRIEFFANATGAASAQGQTFLGAADVTTTNGGTATFSAGLASTGPPGQLITATATDPAGNTSPFSGSVTLTMTDSVGDGIADLWRKTYFAGTGTTTNAQSCATCDPDGDGFTNLQEFSAGTDPTKPSSAFRIVAIQQVSGGETIKFQTVTGKIYRIETKDDLALPNWMLLVDQIVGIGGTNQITDPGATGLSRRFYHAVVLP